MSSHPADFISGIINSEPAKRDPQTVKLTAWGKEREFERYDYFDDTFILETDILKHIENRDPVIMTPKSALLETPPGARRVFGNIMTVSTGNHAVTSLPLLAGKFWDLTAPPEEKRAAILSKHVVCANIVGDVFEISQREVPTSRVVEMDAWLHNLGYPMKSIVLIDRNDETLQYYSRRGQEWRIKPLAWTFNEMRDALRAGLCRMHSQIRYYHNVKGAHFLTLSNFLDWGSLARSDYPEFLRGLNELAAKSAETGIPNLLLKKFRNHHEVELFGPPPGYAVANLVPQLLDLRARAVENKCTPEDAAERFAAIADAFRASLQNSSLADEKSPEFTETLYRNITGAVYSDERVTSDSVRAFDDMRTALPGATYSHGQRSEHEGVDSRSTSILESLEKTVSLGDTLEYANIYELRSDDEPERLGEGRTREIVYKTIWNPLPVRFIEKRLESKSTGYGAYTLARVQAFRALGIAFGWHKLLARNDGSAGDIHYFTRNRYPGDPLSSLPNYYFHDRNPISGLYDNADESPDIVRALITLMGSCAAENMILKKLARDGESILFAKGKEIVEFGYDVIRGKEMPLRIWLCSVRGTMGWRNLEHNEQNIAAMSAFYMKRYAEAASGYSQRHPVLDRRATADAFFAGFTSRTNEIAWNYSTRRDEFDSYNPRLWGDFKFSDKWRFALWSLEIQRDRLVTLSGIFQTEFAKLRE